MAQGQNGTIDRLQLMEEETGRQSDSSFFGVASAMGRFGATFSLGRGDYETYRLMNRDPTLALARAMAKLPIMGATHSFEADDGVPDEVVEAVQHSVDELWTETLETLLWALEYGWKSAELVWDQTEHGIVPVRVKPLAVDETVILVNERTGSFAGVQQGEAKLAWGKMLYYGNEVEDQEYYGISRHENVRSLVWAPWKDLMKRMHTYFEKGSGVIPIVRYPLGKGKDSSGANDTNFKRAYSLINDLTRAKGVCFPSEVAASMADFAIRTGAKLADVAAWSIEFLEAKAGHGEEFAGAARYYDSLKMRGWLVPERAGLEGQMGTKAEAEAHGDVGVGTAEQTHNGLCRAINRQMVDPILSWNFGAGMRGRVRIKPAPLLDDAKSLVREIVKSLLTNPAAIDLLQTTTDLDAMYDLAGVPKGAEVVDFPAPQDPNTPNDPNAPPGAPGQQPPPQPGKPPLRASRRRPADQSRAIVAAMARIYDTLRPGTRPVQRRTIKMAAGTHKWASTYARIAGAPADAVRAMASNIPDDQLAGDGREDNPHVTIKYGLAPDNAELLRPIVEASPPIKLTFGPTSVFASEAQDVLKFDVWSDGLRALNDAIDAAVPHVDKHDWYQPHMTVAYLKPGTGQLYAGDRSLEGQEVVIDRVVFSDRMGNETEIHLRGPSGSCPCGGDGADCSCDDKELARDRVLDCGTGAGGFKPGNDCAKSKGGIASKHDTKKFIGMQEPSSGSVNDIREAGRSGVEALHGYAVQSDGKSKDYHYAKLAGEEFVDKGSKARSDLGAGWGNIYAQTQRKLDQAGIKSVRAFRGTVVDNNSDIAKALASGKLKPGDTIDVRGLKFTSWSTDEKVANTFASNNEAKGKTAIVFERVIPSKDIVASHKTQAKLNSMGEQEVIAMNKEKNVRVRIARVGFKNGINRELAAPGPDDEEVAGEFDLAEYDDQRGIGSRPAAEGENAAA